MQANLRSTLASHLGETLTPEVAAAIEVSARESARPHTLGELIGIALKGDQQAVQWFLMMRDVLHFWDDLIDRDVKLKKHEINAAMFTALVSLPSNDFYLRHRDSLTPLLISAVANWNAANEFESNGEERLLQLAFVIRSDYANLLIHASYLVGGYAWMMEVTPLIRDWWTSEDYPAYKANLLREKSARGEIAPSEVVRTWYEEETSEYIKHGLTVFNAAMLADTEQGHADALAEMIGMKDGQIVVDMGCGIGGVSRLMRNRFPLSTFYGITNVQAQIKIMAEHEDVLPVLCDYHNVPLESGCADVVMFNESIGYGELPVLLDESFRLLKPGGVLAIKDGVSLTGQDEWSSEWQWFTFAKGRIDEAAGVAGFDVEVSGPHEYDLKAYQEFIKAAPS